MLYLVRYSTADCLLILTLRLDDGGVPCCLFFPAISLKIIITLLVLLGHVTFGSQVTGLVCMQVSCCPHSFLL